MSARILSTIFDSLDFEGASPGFPRQANAAQTGFARLSPLEVSSTISAVEKMLIVAKAFKMTRLGRGVR
jgi:hypothetical protein